MYSLSIYYQLLFRICNKRFSGIPRANETDFCNPVTTKVLKGNALKQKRQVAPSSCPPAVFQKADPQPSSSSSFSSNSTYHCFISSFSTLCTFSVVTRRHLQTSSIQNRARSRISITSANRIVIYIYIYIYHVPN
jgi:hypothetical protein